MKGKTMRWRVTCKVGVFWDGPTYPVGSYRFRWMADLAARAHLWRFPLRRCIVQYGA